MQLWTISTVTIHVPTLIHVTLTLTIAFAKMPKNTLHWWDTNPSGITASYTPFTIAKVPKVEFRLCHVPPRWRAIFSHDTIWLFTTQPQHMVSQRERARQGGERGERGEREGREREAPDHSLAEVGDFWGKGSHIHTHSSLQQQHR